MWNRNAPDGLTAHQNAVEGATNYMYVQGEEPRHERAA